MNYRANEILDPSRPSRPRLNFHDTSHTSWILLSTPGPPVATLFLVSVLAVVNTPGQNSCGITFCRLHIISGPAASVKPKVVVALDNSWVQWVDTKSGYCYLHINRYCQICASEVAQALARLYQLRFDVHRRDGSSPRM